MRRAALALLLLAAGCYDFAALGDLYSGGDGGNARDATIVILDGAIPGLDGGPATSDAIVIGGDDGGTMPQLGWSQLPSLGEDLTSVAVHARGAAFVLELGGTVLHTSNGGMVWNTLATTSGEALYGVFSSPSGAYAVAVGTNGLRMFGNSAPGSWNVAANGSFSLDAVWATPSLSFFYTVGSANTVLRSSDLGVGWGPVNGPGGANDELFAVGGDADRVWIVGTAGLVAWTSDGGSSYTPIATHGSGYDLDGVWVDELGYAHVVGTGGMIESCGPLDSYCTVEVGPGGDDFNAIWGASSTDIWAVGNGGAIQHFDGASWRPVPSNVNVNLYAVSGSGSDDVFAVGANGVVLHHP